MTWASIGPAATVIIPAVLAFLASRIGKAGEREGALIVRLQDEIKRRDDRDRERDAKDRERDAAIERLTRQVTYLLRLEGLWDVHATRLEGQITDLGGVPIPRPAALAAQIEED